MVINMHTGRGVSALSRDADSIDYSGLVNILVILLVMSNIKNIMKTLNDKGWVFGGHILAALTDLHNFQFKNMGYILCLQFVVTTPFFSFLIEKYLGANPKFPRKLVFFLIVLNMVSTLSFPIW